MTINLAEHPVGTRFVTREGRKARLIAKDILGDEPYCAAVSFGDTVEGVYGYRADGTSGGTGSIDIVGLAPMSRKVRVLVLPSALAAGRPNSFTILDGDPTFDQPYPSAILDRTIDFDVPAPALVPVERREAA